MVTLAQKWLLFFACLMGFISVAAGAFGAHALKQRLTPDMLSVFEVGARYQMYHAFAICLAVWLSTVIPGQLPLLAGWFFFGGILVFSGTLYLLALTGLRFLGAFTPIGGLLFLIGWVCLAIALFRN